MLQNNRPKDTPPNLSNTTFVYISINFNATHNAYENAWIYDKAFEQIDYSDDFNLEVFKASIYFKNLEKLLIEKIKIADVIVGCVAWFTNENIINALSKKSGVSIIVQKEGFLRRDHNSSSQNWQVKLKKKLL